MAAGVQGQGALAQAIGAIPVAGPVGAAGISAVQRAYQSYVQLATGRLGAFGAAGLGERQFRRGEARGAGLGLMPGQTQGLLAQMGAQTGLRDEALMEAALPQRGLLAQQRIMGFGNLGGVIGGAGVAGGRESPVDLMSEAVATGVQSGFREGRLDRFFAQFGSWIEQVRTQGIMLSAQSGMQLVRGMAGLGPSFTGEAGARAAMNVQQAMGGIGRGRGTGQLMFLRAAGMAGGQHGERTFMAARVHAAARPAEVMRNFLADMRQMAGGQDITPDVLATAMEPLFQEAGLQFAPRQLMDMAQAVISGGDLSQFLRGPEEAAQEDARAMEARRRRQYEGMAAAPVSEAGFERRRAALGGREAVENAAQEIRDFELTLGELFVPAVASVVARMRTAAGHAARGDWFEAARSLAPDVIDELGGGRRRMLRPGTPEYEAAQQRRQVEAREGAMRQILEDARRRGVPEQAIRQGRYDVDVGEITTQQLRERMRELTPGIGTPGERIMRAGEEIQAAGRELDNPSESDLSQRPQ
jgi:hypothetical protein